ncbi:MAG: hypothetical protein R3Y11_12580 [Pseudomonadota bacterium]
MTAKLTGTVDMSPTVYINSQLVGGTTAITGDYVSTAIYAGEETSIVKVIADVYLPSGTTLSVYVAATYENFESMGSPSSTTELGDGWVEMQWMVDDFNKTSARCKLVLTGNAAARPQVKNLRMLTTN